MHPNNESLFDYLTMRYHQTVEQNESALKVFIELEPHFSSLSEDQKSMVQSMSSGLRNIQSEIKDL
nr:hypothetical protein [uncultured Mediterranean phage uvMED]